MVQEISRREVLNNLIRFKDSLLEKRESREGRKGGEIGKRAYRALFNRKTGDLRFTQKISALEPHIARKGARKESAADWKEIQIVVSQENKSDAAQFEMLDVHNHSLKPSDIEPLAWLIASETLDVLNQRAEEVKGQKTEMLPEEAALHDLSSIRISVGKDRIEVLPGWKNAIGRVEAEHILDGKPEGTYLIREGDELTLSISFHFGEENHLKIHPYLVTVVEKEGKISDILLLQTNKGWIVYHDDPNLNDKSIYEYFPSAQALLSHINKTARRPLS